MKFSDEGLPYYAFRLNAQLRKERGELSIETRRQVDGLLADLEHGRAACPFCGTPAVIDPWHKVHDGDHTHDNGHYAAICSDPDCGAQGPWRDTLEGAHEAWRRRSLVELEPKGMG